VCWLPKGTSEATLVVRRHEAALRLPARLQTEAPEGVWRLEGDGFSLAFVPGSAPVHSELGGQLSSLDQLGEVSGRLPVAGADTELSCPGWRSSVEAAAGLERLDSFRLVAGWFDGRAGFSLTALRPDKARGQEDDLVSAALIEDPPAPPVVDPRLSTTYTETGLPTRAGLELWPPEPEEAGQEAGQEPAPHYPRRAAGEVLGAGLAWSEADFDLQALFVQWHSQGREGPGVYVLGRRR
jgi:hypothetical protein